MKKQIKKISVLAIMAIAVNILVLPAFSVSGNNQRNLTNNESLVSDFVQSIGDWDSWLSYYTISAQEMYYDFINDSDNRANNMGILTVTSASVLSIEKIDNIYAPKFPEIISFYESDNNYETYLVGMDMEVNEETEYFNSGVNYKLVVLVNNNGVWEVGSQSGASIEAMLESNSSYVDEAILRYSIRVHGKSARGVGYGLLSPGPQPTSIKTFYNNQVYTVSFSDYINPPINT
ncbi:MAG: hypothetical protein FWG44_07060 [Oscillospiraceae bacterium]|nr:hypothetical protein [Oscillospiraceae bacterium]